MANLLMSGYVRILFCNWVLISIRAVKEDERNKLISVQTSSIAMIEQGYPSVKCNYRASTIK